MTKIFENSDCEIHAVFDIPSVELAMVKALIEKKDTKEYVIVIIRKPKK